MKVNTTAGIFGIKYGIRNSLKISNPLNTKYLVGCVAPPLGLEKVFQL